MVVVTFSSILPWVPTSRSVIHRTSPVGGSGRGAAVQVSPAPMVPSPPAWFLLEISGVPSKAGSASDHPVGLQFPQIPAEVPVPGMDCAHSCWMDTPAKSRKIKMNSFRFC